MYQYEPRHGTTVAKAAEEMVAIANKTNTAVEGEFNGIILIAKPGEDPQKIADLYYEQYMKRANSLAATTYYLY
ncbi:MAG: hypothetical protein HYU81_01660 [Candidatus Brennerbacteria bacterium]|nr:hypothetical protein [Candidatus Brennerbacteria bacterium]